MPGLEGLTAWRWSEVGGVYDTSMPPLCRSAQYPPGWPGPQLTSSPQGHLFHWQLSPLTLLPAPVLGGPWSLQLKDFWSHGGPPQKITITYMLLLILGGCLMNYGVMWIMFPGWL